MPLFTNGICPKTKSEILKMENQKTKKLKLGIALQTK